MSGAQKMCPVFGKNCSNCVHYWLNFSFKVLKTFTCGAFLACLPNEIFIQVSLF